METNNLLKSVDVLTKFSDIINNNHVVNSKPKFKEHVVKLYNFGKKWLIEKNILNLKPNDIMQLTTNLMAVVQTIQKQEKMNDENKGVYKKELVQIVVYMLITDKGIVVPPGMTFDNVMDFTFQHLLPGIIETTLEVVSGRVNIQKTVKRVSKCIGFCNEKKMCKRHNKNNI